MTRASAPVRRRPGASLRRLIVAALLLAATLPTLGVGILASLRLGVALQEDARLRTDRAATTAHAYLVRAAADLERLVSSYATWPQLAATISGGQLDVVRRDVLEFLVEQGRVAAAVLVAGNETLAAGSLEPGGWLATVGPSGASAVRSLGDGLYLVGVADVVDPTLAGVSGSTSSEPTASPATGVLARLVFARRLDAQFAVELRDSTGFDVAVVDGTGRLTVATDPEAIRALGPLDPLPTRGEREGLLFARIPFGADGSPAGNDEGPPSNGQLILSARLSAAQAATGELPAIVGGLAGLTAVAAVVLALWLLTVLGRRLGAVHDGLLAIADGRQPPPLPIADDDPVDQLADALGRLVTALDRRETTVRRCLEAVTSVPVDQSPRQVAAALLEATDDIFGLRWSAILEPDGTLFASSSGSTELPVGLAPTNDSEGTSSSEGHKPPATSPEPAPSGWAPVVVVALDPRAARRPGAGPGPSLGRTGPLGRSAGPTEGAAGDEFGPPAPVTGRRLVAAVGPPPPAPTAAASAETSRASFASPRVAAQGIEAVADSDDAAATVPRPPAGDGAPPSWTPADEATLRLMAALIGSAIEDAERYATAAERAIRLDRLNQIQRQFLRSISHNLKTPLATIGLAVDDLAEAVASDPYLSERAQAIRSETARLGRLVEQVLTLSRLEAGTVDLAAEPLVPAEVVAAIWRELDVERPFVINDRTGRRVVVVDRRALEQILWNLLDNAVRYAPTGPIEVRLELRRATPEGPVASRQQAPPGEAEAAPATPATPATPAPPAVPAVLEIAVLDEGPGVPPGERGRIFHRFTRGSTAGHRAGTGLGLSLARSLARLMGGDLVYVDRGPGHGASFALRLPLPTASTPPWTNPAEAPGVAPARQR